MSYEIKVSQDSDGNIRLRYSGDAQGIVDACADAVRERRERGPKGPGDMRRVMSIDPLVLMEIARVNKLSVFDPQVFEIAKGRDYSKFRTVTDKLLFKGK